MELDDLKKIWLTEKKELENRIIVNEKLASESILNKSRSTFDNLLTTSIIGRNLAVVYMIISVTLAAKVIREFEYSIPALIGAAAMLLSFFQHISLKKPDFSKMNTIELQKAICQFRMHAARYSKYDFLIMSLWILTITPLYFEFILQIHVALLPLFSIITLLIVLIFVFWKYIYRRWDKELKENEEQLKQIIDFEKD